MFDIWRLPIEYIDHHNFIIQESESAFPWISQEPGNFL